MHTENEKEEVNLQSDESDTSVVGVDVHATNAETNPEVEVPEVNEDGTYNINIFRVKSSKNQVLPKHKSNLTTDFRVSVIVNNSVARPIADTGAGVAVCGSVQAKNWNLLDRMVPSKVKLKPYGSTPIPVIGTARCAVTFGSTSIPVEWHVISGSCEPILSGRASLQLGIIKFNSTPEVFHPVLMIDKDAVGHAKQKVQDLLGKYPQIFTGLGRLKDYKVKFHVKPGIKPIRDAPRTIPYHLCDRANNALQEMIEQGVVEEHPTNKPSPWVSNVVFCEKDDGSLRVTVDAKNVNKAIQSSNLPIPRQEDIKAKLAHKKFYSKLDFKSAFWQLELDEESRDLTVFQMLGKLYRHTVLTMGFKPSQGELNAALVPLFAHISDVHVIHDDVVVATTTEEEHVLALQAVLETIANAGLTLNPAKCVFLQKEIKFWGMIIGESGVRPDPEKVDDL